MKALQLRLSYDHGQPVNDVLLSVQQHTSLAELLLAAGVYFADDDQFNFRYCLFRQHDSGWMLVNAGQMLLVAVNDHRIATGEYTELHDGDRLEVGLLVFAVVIVGETADDIASSRQQTAEDDFVLIDLTFAPMDSDVIGAVGDDVTIPKALYTPEQKKQQRQQPASLSADDTPDNMADKDDMSGEDDVLHALHNEYEQVLRDPSLLSSAREWREQQRVDKQRQKTLNNLLAEAESIGDLHDMVAPSQSIEQIMARLSHFHETSWLLAPEQGVNVVHLFSSDDEITAESDVADDIILQRLIGKEPTRSRKMRLPELTRREHHGIGVDGPVTVDWSPANNNKGDTHDQ